MTERGCAASILAEERDSCGIGFVADLQGRRRHQTLALAIEALGNLRHRGAVGSDGATGDGAGVLTQVPHALLRDELAALGVSLPSSAPLAVGVFFASCRGEARRRAQREVERQLARANLQLLAWRKVPTRRAVLGEDARRSCPLVLQALVGLPPGLDEGAGERLLYLTRRRIERHAPAGLYVASLSHRTVVYKAMCRAHQLADFYPDLRDPRYATALALFHQRFSTNTMPQWRLAQPFRLLGHNGEINTIEGNANWMAARERELRSSLWGDEVAELLPVLQEGGSDSALLDNALELLVMFGRDLLHALMMLIPEAPRPGRDPALQAFIDYHATLMEPWDGPAAVVVSDGRVAAAILDRNGLRPQRYWVTDDGLVVLGSETGIVELPPQRVVKKGRLGPGEILAVDVERHQLLDNATIKARYARRRPYGEWLGRHLRTAPPPRALAPPEPADAASAEAAPGRERLQRAFGYSHEVFERILDPMLRDGKQPVGSMGDDTPPAALSRQPQLLYRYFKQRFAQVTNPAIDPLRERMAFSLETMVGSWGCVIDEVPEAAHLLRFESPLLGHATFEWLTTLADVRFQAATLGATFDVGGGAAALRAAVDRLCATAEAAVDGGATLLVLSDRALDRERAPIPMLLATSAVHRHLIRVRKRMQVSLVCDTGEPREDHHFACLIGFGATLVHPWLALRGVAHRARLFELDPEQAAARYLQTAEEGLLKIMAKLGVCAVASYQSAQLFEALGLDRELIDRHFTGTPSRVGGASWERITRDVAHRHREAWEADVFADRGLFRFRKDGEHHALHPGVFTALHKAVRSNRLEDFREYQRRVEETPPTSLRDLLDWRRRETPLPLDEVEPVEAVLRRFCTAAMSHGALSREAHEAVAVAVNRLGGRSNSGEGGEAAERFTPYGVPAPQQAAPPAEHGEHGGLSLVETAPGTQGAAEPARPRLLSKWQPAPGDWGNSAIKQVASGRFGVTAHYLRSARELEIKIAQGSKPGEGGQIPGNKVTAEIASLRHATPGVSLISPPPHHDIYSIEDLAQLIFDLKRVHPEARVGVKLVSGYGVGTIAAGVAKAHADYVHISGDSGGTGASPLSSIRHAGMPWELGLAEAQQALVQQGLRGRVTLRVDGGMKTGRDVVIAALLGADELGFGTVPLIALGCIMARQCHLNTCPVGIATQDPELRRRMPGTPDQVVAYLLFVAQQVRLALAEIGARSLGEIVGRSELLRARPRTGAGQAGETIDLSFLLAPPPAPPVRRRAGAPPPLPFERGEAGLDERLWADARAARVSGAPVRLRYAITNRDRSVGARLSGALAQRTAGAGLPPRTVDVELDGVGGQSFGAFLVRGVRLRLFGEAQDYVGKGMSGGEIVLRPPREARFIAEDNVIAGNTILYGATGGSFFAAGRVGERFCVRNSGAEAVVEGCGDHGCEYMTGGVAVVLGPTGANFGAGMTGGIAFVWDGVAAVAEAASGLLSDQVRSEPLDDRDAEHLRDLLRRHADATGSDLAACLLLRWEPALRQFRKVVPSSVPAVVAEPAASAAAGG
jgi:glutamate synthase domain-containing protein 2/glutamate synthase domain-containing protein 1/glutamate synthase domain-containing protein 3